MRYFTGYVILSFLKVFFRRYYYNGNPILKIRKRYYRNSKNEYYNIIMNLHGFSYVLQFWESYAYDSYLISDFKKIEKAENAIKNFYKEWEDDLDILEMDRKSCIIKEYVYERRLSKDEVIDNLEKQVELLSRSDKR